jgi:hypothetical protein
VEDLGMIAVDEMKDLPVNALAKAFLRKASKVAEPAVQVEAGASLTSAVDTAALSALLGKKEDKKEHVDMSKKLGDVSFVGLDATLWPASKELDNMAGELVKARKNGMPKCFLFVDLRSDSVIL